jgi:hypothetical protein
MARFAPGTTIATAEPVVTVDAGLTPGQYRFRLVVADEEENQSAPVEELVTVRQPVG